MLGKIKYQPQSSLFFSLESTLNQKHPLLILSHKVNWEVFEGEFSPLYCHENGRPSKPIRLMAGLLILKHLRNLSDDKDVYFDTTVQEKNIGFPSGDKLAKGIIRKCHKITRANGLEPRQSYTRTLKKPSYGQRFRIHPKNKGKAEKAGRKVKTIAGRLVRDVERKLGEKVSGYQETLELFKQVLAQKRNDKNKTYSLHGPQACCISKAKEHKLYEFGNKASIAWASSGVVAGALGFRNEYDGHTLDKSIGQVERPRQSAPKNGIADRGYRGRNKARETAIHIPKAFSKA